MPVNRACEVSATYVASSVLDARGGVGEGPADGQALHSDAAQGLGAAQPAQQRAGAEAGGPGVHSKLSTGESPTEAMSRWAQGSFADEVLEEQRRGDRAGTAGRVVGVGDRGGQLLLVVGGQREPPQRLARRPRRRRGSRRRAPRCWRRSRRPAGRARPSSRRSGWRRRRATSGSSSSTAYARASARRAGPRRRCWSPRWCGRRSGGRRRRGAARCRRRRSRRRRPGRSPATGQPTAASAPMTAITTAPPVMSRFMLTIASAGLIERPPVSKVMPLPTSTTCGVPCGRPCAGCSRAGSAAAGVAEARPTPRMPPKPSAASASRPRPDLEPGLLGEHHGLVGQPGRVLDVGRDRREHPRAPAGAADRERAVECRRRSASSGRPARTIRADRRVLGRARSASGRRRSRAWRRRRTPRAPPSGAIAGIEVATRPVAGGPGQRGAGPPEVAARCSPTPTSSTQRRSGCRRRRAGPAPRRPRRPCRWPRAARARRAGRCPSSSASSAAPGPSRTASPSSPREHRERHDLDAADGVREGALSANSGGETWLGRVGGVAVSARRQPTTSLRASPRAPASSALSSTTSRPPPSSGTRITMPRPSLVTSSGPSPVRGFIAAMRAPLPSSIQSGPVVAARPRRSRIHYPLSRVMRATGRARPGWQTPPMHARSALFDVYGDHLRGRGSQAPVAGPGAPARPGRHRRAGGTHRHLAHGHAGLARARRLRRRPWLPRHAARSGGSTRPRTGSTGVPTRPGTAPGSSPRRPARDPRGPQPGCAPTSGSWGTPSWPPTCG